MTPTGNLRSYSRAAAADLLRRLEEQVRRAHRRLDVEAVHDLRVSIRRFSQCLDVFAEVLGHGAARRIGRRIRALRRAAGATRDLDIALEHLAAHSAPAALLRQLRVRRRVSAVALALEVARWIRRQPWNRWRRRLESPR